MGCLRTCMREMEISGAGTPNITIEGVTKLGGNTHSVIADRIELGTYMLAPAICAAVSAVCWRVQATRARLCSQGWGVAAHHDNVHIYVCIGFHAWVCV